jgi:hypothetical protein
MKTENIFFLLFLMASILTKAQNNASVEKSNNNIQIGAVGVWFNNESKLAGQFVLRTEIGLYSEIVDGNGFFMAPELTLEPRWYYNIKKRGKKGKNTSKNAANFFTIKTSYRSDIFEILHDRGKGAENSISFVPKWGIRRNLGKYFNYELGIGFGYLTFFDQKYFTVFDANGPVVDLHFRIGINL